MNLKEKARTLTQKTLALYFALKHPQTGFLPKIVIFITVAYALSPIDLIPDFIPVLGYLDDIIILPLLIRLAVALIPKHVMEECLEKSKEAGGKLKKRWAAAAWVFAAWGLMLFLITRKVVRIIQK